MIRAFTRRTVWPSTVSSTAVKCKWYISEVISKEFILEGARAHPNARCIQVTILTLSSHAACLKQERVFFGGGEASRYRAPGQSDLITQEDDIGWTTSPTEKPYRDKVYIRSLGLYRKRTRSKEQLEAKVRTYAESICVGKLEEVSNIWQLFSSDNFFCWRRQATAELCCRKCPEGGGMQCTSIWP